MAGFTFHKAEQYYTQLEKTARSVSEGMAGKPKENVAEHYRGDAYKDIEILWQKDWQTHLLRG